MSDGSKGERRWLGAHAALPSPLAWLTLLAAALLLVACGENAAERAVALAAGDPDARFQAMRQAGSYVCGEVNANGATRSRSYARFVYDARTDAASIDPRLTDVRVSIGSTDPVCAKPHAYLSVDERLGCAAAPGLEADRRRQNDFEKLWLTACGGEEA